MALLEYRVHPLELSIIAFKHTSVQVTKHSLTGSTKYPEHFGFERIGDPPVLARDGDGAGITLKPDRNTAIFGFDDNCAVSWEAWASLGGLAGLFSTGAAAFSDSESFFDIDSPRSTAF